MPVPPEDDRKSLENLPDPDLNPMSNTLLAQNMGRWAEVYFTTPAEKRDEAVRELLRELRSGVIPEHISISEEKIPPSQGQILDTKQKFAELENKFAELQCAKPAEGANTGGAEPKDCDMVCPACLSKNKAGQRFCGLCGFTLSSNRPSPSKEEQPVVNPTIEAQPIERAGDDWSWLHERNRTALEPKHDRKNWKYAIIALLILIACGLAYFWWRGGLQTSSADDKAPAGAVQESGSNSTLPARQADQSGPESDRAANARSVTAPATSHGKAQSAAPVSTATTESASPAAPVQLTQDSGSAVEGGRQELEMALRYREGRGVQKDSALAAEWLWKSVAKQNSQAVVMLSEMYAAGEGVPRSCDQARLLLSAAAQRGSQEAQERLQSIVSSCQ